MSVVGPRPPLPEEGPRHQHIRHRMLVKPGITGPWQVSGRSSLSKEESESFGPSAMCRTGPCWETSVLLSALSVLSSLIRVHTDRRHKNVTRITRGVLDEGDNEENRTGRIFQCNMFLLWDQKASLVTMVAMKHLWTSSLSTIRIIRA